MQVGDVVSYWVSVSAINRHMRLTCQGVVCQVYDDNAVVRVKRYFGGIDDVPLDRITLDVIDNSCQPISSWFELSYAQFLTVPRLVMESMPLGWQRKMAALLQEMDDTFDWRPKGGRYWVRLRDAPGRFTDAPLNDYRHGSCEHLRK
jgi:hypothetical protein